MMDREAGKRIAEAADLLHSVFFPGDEVRGPREGVDERVIEAVGAILKHLGEAEDFLNPGIGRPNVGDGLKAVREAMALLERLVPPFMLGGVDELVVARADVLRQLDAVLDARLVPST